MPISYVPRTATRDVALPYRRALWDCGGYVPSRPYSCRCDREHPRTRPPSGFEVPAHRRGTFRLCQGEEISPRNYETMSAFANATCELFVCIENGKARCSPMVWLRSAQDPTLIPRCSFELFSLGLYFTYAFLTCCSVTRESFSSPRILEDAGHFALRRTASSTCAVARKAFRTLIRESPSVTRSKGITTARTSDPRCSVRAHHDLRTIICFMLDVVPSAEPEAWLRKTILIDDSKSTVADLLCSG